MSESDESAALIQRLRSRWPGVAAEMLADGLESYVPDGLPDDHFTHDVLPVMEIYGLTVLDAIGSGRELSYNEIHAFTGPVAERHAEDRLPLQLLLSGIHGSANVLIANAAELATPDEALPLVQVVKRLVDVLCNITLSVVSTYTEVEQSLYHAEREARRELCAALVDGRPVQALAARADIAVADAYLVITINVPGQAVDTPATNLLARRRTRVLQRAFDELTSTTTPFMFDGLYGVALIAEIPVAEQDRAHARFDELAAALTQQFGTPVFLGEMAEVAPDGVPTAVRETTGLTELACALGRAPGAYRLDDLLIEYQVTRPSLARDRLAQRIAPLRDHPHLVAALRAHLQHGANRKAAAAEVHVHPNTLSYRLRRIHELTGHDPTVPYDSRVLAAALTVDRVCDR
ncbi:PucR family transcriptional regulator [Gordonia sp. DT101]|uniref:PucR family transcriptional regulator n=1 Tax=Gordonia sp. DT101 TaxID=3416545 RepID=UPI003CF4BDA5